MRGLLPSLDEWKKQRREQARLVDLPLVSLPWETAKGLAWPVLPGRLGA